MRARYKACSSRRGQREEEVGVSDACITGTFTQNPAEHQSYTNARLIGLYGTGMKFLDWLESPGEET